MDEAVKARRRAAALTQYGIDLFFKCCYAEALECLEEALALDPSAVRSYCGKALCLAQMGDARGAFEVAQRAVELDPHSPIAYTTRALCYHRVGMQDEAIADYTRAIELDPTNYIVYYNFGCYWAERGQEEKCREYLELAFEMAPGHFADSARLDPDLARYSRREWFLHLIAELKKRSV